MCMTVGCNLQINFCNFFHSSDLVFFGLKAFDTGYLVNTTPPTVLAGSF